MRKALNTGKSLAEAFLALFAALSIYYFFRKGKNFYFFSLPDFLNSNRPQIYLNSTFVTDFFRYSLPDGLWLYAFLCFLRMVFSLSVGTTSHAAYWYSAAIFFAVAFEFGQFFGYTTGTFDKNDLLAYLFLTLIFFLKT